MLYKEISTLENKLHNAEDAGKDCSCLTQSPKVLLD